MYTGLFMPKQKEVEKPKELAKSFITNAIRKLPEENTLWLVKQRIRGVCGNDPRFDGVTTFSERIGEFYSLWNNPYVFNSVNAFENDYIIDDKIFIIGESYLGGFTSKSILYLADTLIATPPIYDIKSAFIDKNNINFSLVDYAHSDSLILQTKMVFVKGTWQAQ